MTSPEKDPRVADLASYRKAREKARKLQKQIDRKLERMTPEERGEWLRSLSSGADVRVSQRRPAPQKGGGESFLGSRPKAGLILAVVVVVLLLIYVAPKLPKFM